jgi:hypothetical protein
MADTALAEIARTALAGEHRHGRVAPGFGGDGGATG